MNFATALATLSALFFSSALAGYNCKCQDPSGTGPQNNDHTKTCCANGPDQPAQTCSGWNYPGPNNQCSSGGSNCLNSGLFDQCCKDLGSPGAYCWE